MRRGGSPVIRRRAFLLEGAENFQIYPLENNLSTAEGDEGKCGERILQTAASFRVEFFDEF